MILHVRTVSHPEAGPYAILASHYDTRPYTPGASDDASGVAITALNTEALNLGVRDRIDSRVHDLDDGLPADLAGSCALVICQRFRDPALYEQLVYMLQPEGVLVITVQSRVGRTGEPGRFHATPGELIDAFRELDVDILRSLEADGEATLVARRR